MGQCSNNWPPPATVSCSSSEDLVYTARPEDDGYRYYIAYVCDKISCGTGDFSNFGEGYGIFIVDAGAGGDTVDCSAAPYVGVQPGDTVLDGNIGAVVPSPGESVYAGATGTAGSEALGIHVYSASDIRIEDCGPDAQQDVAEELGRVAGQIGQFADEWDLGAPETLAASPPDACQDPAFKTYSYKWTSSYHWYFKRSSTPDYLNKDDVRDALKQATNAITDVHTDCATFGDGSTPSDVVPINHSYEGTTTRNADISSTAVCKTRDGFSVTDFGNLPSDFAGFFCTWPSNNGNTALESDTRLNKRDGTRWEPHPTSSCTTEFSVRAVATHERGHTFGLRHVSELNHGNLTMGKSVDPCSDDQYTLGWGDFLGLKDVY